MTTDHFILKSYEFKPAKDSIEFKKAGFGDSGFGGVEITHHKSSINFQSHKITTTWGFSKGYPGAAKPDYNCQFDLPTKTEKDRAFKKGLEKLDQLILEGAYENRVEWDLFGNQTESERATFEDVKKKYYPIVRKSKNSDYPDTFKASFIKKYDSESNENKIMTIVHNNQNERITPSEETIPRKSICVADFQAKSVWIGPDRKFGIKFYMPKMKVYPPKQQEQTNNNLPTEKCMFNDDYDDYSDDDNDSSNSNALPKDECLF